MWVQQWVQSKRPRAPRSVAGGRVAAGAVVAPARSCSLLLAPARSGSLRLAPAPPIRPHGRMAVWPCPPLAPSICSVPPSRSLRMQRAPLSLPMQHAPQLRWWLLEMVAACGELS